jgi:hypothetical protein
MVKIVDYSFMMERELSMNKNESKCKTLKDGTKKWYKNNKLHRIDGPAVEWEDGDKWWCKNGKYHREDGPAVEGKNGSKEYWLNDKRHREDGPAIEWVDGTKLWYKDGMRHREDGPAVEFVNGGKEYWLNNKKVKEEDLPINKWPKCTTDDEGVKYWKNKGGELHREDGPAKEFADGSKEWWLNDKRHRIDGPAIEWTDGTKAWFINGQYHREDGPAIEHADGYKCYYLNGIQVKEEDLPINSKCMINAMGDKCWYKNGLYHRENGPAIECTNGTKAWYINGICHREDGPAVERYDGEKKWYKNGILHRVDGPAKEYSNGDKEYWLNGELVKEKDLPINKEKELIKEEWPKCELNEFGNKYWRNEKGELHRLDGPAIEFVNGDKNWYVNGKLHRDDGPALENVNGYKAWYKKDKLHRLDGPAREFANGHKEWWINGINVRKKDLSMNKNKNESKCKVLKDGTKKWYKNNKLHRLDGPAIEWADGDKYWYKEGKYHRENGPAIEWSNGTKEWYINGLHHRIDEPAIEYNDGAKQWYKNGFLHREDGPACESANGDKYYYLNGNMVEEKDLPINKEKELKEEWPKCTIDERGSKIWKNKEGEYHRDDGPAIEYIDGDKEWFINGKLHREDGPAVEFANGDKIWYKNGKLHREDGPAKEFAAGDKEWWLNGQFIEDNMGLSAEEQAEQAWKDNNYSKEATDDECQLDSGKINKTNIGDVGYMSNVMKLIKDDSKKAIYRTAGTQATKLVKNSIINVLRNSNVKENQLAAVAGFLNSEVGKAFVSFILGMGLTHAPKIKDNKHCELLAREMRVNGISGAGTFFTSSILTTLMPMLAKSSELRIENVPEATSVEEELAVVEEAVAQETAAQT